MADCVIKRAGKDIVLAVDNRKYAVSGACLDVIAHSACDKDITIHTVGLSRAQVYKIAGHFARNHIVEVRYVVPNMTKNSQLLRYEIIVQMCVAP